MDDYISRKEAVDAFFPVDPENDGSDGTTPIYLERNYSNNEIESILWEVPAADVEPVRHGRWEVHEESDECYGYIRWLECSLCHESIGVSARLRYCPSCGAKMDLEGENNDD